MQYGMLTEKGSMFIQYSEFLYLDENRLSGSLPMQLKDCTSLVDLRLRMNSFASTIPNQWVSLKNLQTLILDEANLRGTIPELFNQMRQLETLQIFKNEFTGPLPRSLGEVSALSTCHTSECATYSSSTPSNLILTVCLCFYRSYKYL